MTDRERACEYRCARRPCEHILECEYAALYVAGMNAGRKEREGEIKQVEKSREEIQTEQNLIPILPIFSPFCGVNEEDK